MNLQYYIRPAAREEMPVVMSLIASGREIMHSSGNLLQWPEGTPSEAKVSADIAAGCSFLVFDGKSPVATFAFVPGPDPTYDRIDGGRWLNDEPYHVIHRLAKLPTARGVFNAVLDWCFSKDSNIRIDTHEDNAIMRHCIEAYGFVYCGIIYLENGDERLAFQKKS